MNGPLGLRKLYMRKCIAHSFARTSDDYISDISQCTYPLMHERANQGLQVHSKVMLNGQLRVCKMSPYIWKQRNSSEALSHSVQWPVSRKVSICVYGLATKDKQWLLDKYVHHDKITLIWRFVLCY